MSPTPTPAPAPDTPRLAWGTFVVAVVALLFGLIALVVAIGADDDAATPADTGDVVMTESVPSTIPSTTATSPTSPITPSPTSSPASTVLLPATASPEPSPAIWPRAGSAVRYDDPVDAARGFAVEFVGFDPPIVGEFLAGDSRSGDVEVRSRPNGQPTVVHVRQVDGDDWAVIGASNANITVIQPAALAEVESPMTLTGSATAFEGTVEVLLYSDGSDQPIVESFVTGSGSPEPGPFADVVEWTTATSEGATLLLRSTSPEDGSVVDATATRLRFHAVMI